MHTEQIFIVGAGGHGKVVLDALLLIGIAPGSISISDGDAALLGKNLFGIAINVPAIQEGAEHGRFHVAIGNGVIRQRMFGQLTGMGSKPLTVLHPAAIISRFADVGAGVFVASGAIVGPSACLRQSVIINHGAVVDHDCVVGEFSHIAPNATLGGGVTVGARVMIGAGANLLPNIKIGDGAVIGAGAVVLSDVEAGDTRVGVPAVSVTRSRLD
jgi:sugar O-acyltransferase (sialic acid O-acetyltransferase NeuD family)